MRKYSVQLSRAGIHVNSANKSIITCTCMTDNKEMVEVRERERDERRKN